MVIEHVNRTFVEIDTTTTQNVAFVEESAAASERLRKEATSLTYEISVFLQNAPDCKQ
jgi:methyl-accepting chemotaxis protein